jgi:hypothetical protein
LAQANPVANTDILPPGVGLLVRKAASGTGLSAMWLNPPAYGEEEVGATGIPESDGNFESFGQVAGASESPSGSALAMNPGTTYASAAAPAIQPSLTAKQRKALRRIVSKRDPAELGLKYRRWSKRAINAVVEKRFGIKSPDTADRKFLQRLGSTSDQPAENSRS